MRREGKRIHNLFSGKPESMPFELKLLANNQKFITNSLFLVKSCVDLLFTLILFEIYILYHFIFEITNIIVMIKVLLKYNITIIYTII